MSNVNVFAVDVTPGGFPTGMTNVPTAAGNVPVRIHEPVLGPDRDRPGDRPGDSGEFPDRHAGTSPPTATAAGCFDGSGLNVGNVRALQPLAGAAGMRPHPRCRLSTARLGIDGGCVDRSNTCAGANARFACEPGRSPPLRRVDGRGRRWSPRESAAARAICSWRRWPPRCTRVQGAIQAEDADRVGQQ